jgi:opacity protein-like surface antigen
MFKLLLYSYRSFWGAIPTKIIHQKRMEMRMKIAALVLTLLALLASTGFAQAPAVGAVSIGFGAEAGVPVGDLKNASDFGIGGMGWIAYDVDPSLTLTGKVGYISFSGKSPAPSLNIIPVLVGGRYMLTPAMEVTSMRSYIGVDAGLYSMSASGFNSSTKFGIAPALGAQFSAGPAMDVDIHVSYATIFSDPSSSSWVGVGIGLEFGM